MSTSFDDVSTFAISEHFLYYLFFRCPPTDPNYCNSMAKHAKTAVKLPWNAHLEWGQKKMPLMPSGLGIMSQQIKRTCINDKNILVWLFLSCFDASNQSNRGFPEALVIMASITSIMSTKYNIFHNMMFNILCFLDYVWSCVSTWYILSYSLLSVDCTYIESYAQFIILKGLRPEYSGRSRSVRVMTACAIALAPLGHQQQWYWLGHIDRSLSSRREISNPSFEIR